MEVETMNKTNNYKVADISLAEFGRKEIQMAEFIIAAVKSEITPQAFIKGLIQAELDDKI